MCEATLLDDFHLFRLDNYNKESAVKSTLPPEDWQLSVSTVVITYLDFHYLVLLLTFLYNAQP